VISKAVAVLLASSACQGALWDAEPLTTITPCPEATGLTLPPITVTTQYQEVSTCQPKSACIRHKCTAIFPLTKYLYVSTVVPYAWNGTTTQTTTVTDLSQPFRASEHLETLTQTVTSTVTPSVTEGPWKDWMFAHGRTGSTEPKPKPTTTTSTFHETVTRRALAPFNEIGPLAVPGWEGSGTCQQCVNQTDGSRSQLLDIVECRFGLDQNGEPHHICSEWSETWIERPAPTSTVLAGAVCASQGTIYEPGTYTWTFPQVAPPATITAPPTTITTTVTENHEELIVVEPETVYTIPGRPWTAYVTQSFSVATTFTFDIYVTSLITVNIPCITRPGERYV
jgi:hypothetical protein